MRSTRMEDLMLYTITISVVIWCLECATVDGGRVLGPIYWNTSNSMFSASEDNKIEVDIDDKLDIICPRKGKDENEEHFFFKLYLVSAENYRKCNATGGKRLINCDVPDQEKKYTFYFQKISPSPWGLEFTPDKSYYVISTSDGSRSGMESMRGGACTHYNMKLEMKIHEKREDLSDKSGESIEESIPTNPIQTNPGHNSEQKPHNNLPNISSEQDTSSEIDSKGGNNVNNKNQNNNSGNSVETDSTNSGNNMWLGIVLGACAVLIVLFVCFAVYKLYRKRHNMKKYQSSPIGASRPGDPMSQVTLMPISAATRHHSSSSGGPGSHHTRIVSDHDGRHHSSGMGTHVSDMRPPPSYNESFLDNGGSIVAV